HLRAGHLLPETRHPWPAARGFSSRPFRSDESPARLFPASACLFPSAYFRTFLERLSSGAIVEKLDSGLRRPHPAAGRRHYPRAPRLVRSLFVHGNFHSVLLLPIADGRLDGVFGEDGAVNLHGRQ